MRHLIGQPKGLYPLFFTELWERFGFYTVQAILILYMSSGLGYSDDKAYLVYGAFSALIYLTPVAGGYLADHYLGFRRSVTIGGILFILGYAIMAIPGPHALFLGMSIVVVANGFFKPNVSSMVGDLYTEEDPRRDGGYTIFYMGINIGGLFPPLFTGPLVNRFGWNAGFICASLGIMIGLATFLTNRRKLAQLGQMPSHSPFQNKSKRIRHYLVFAAGILATIVLIHGLFAIPKETDVIIAVSSCLIVSMVIYYLFKEPPELRRRLWACLIFLFISTGFWAVYVQTYTSLMLYADRNVSKEFLGISIDPEFVQFFNPLYIILLSPILSWFWIWLDAKRMNPSTSIKFALGVLAISASFLILGGAARYFSPDGYTSMWWVAFCLLFLTIGELFLSPTGLAMITRLVPRHLVGMMMGVWFLTVSVGFAIGGWLSTFSDVPKSMPALGSIQIYSKAFLLYGSISAILAIIAFAVVPLINKLKGPKHS